MNIPKALVTSMIGHEDMIDYMSTYRSPDKFKGKQYLARGGLFWFTCNQYGDLTGSCYFIKRVPDEELLKESFHGLGYRKVIKKKKKTLTVPQIFCEDKYLAKDILNEIRPKLKQ